MGKVSTEFNRLSLCLFHLVYPPISAPIYPIIHYPDTMHDSHVARGFFGFLICALPPFFLVCRKMFNKWVKFSRRVLVLFRFASIFVFHFSLQTIFPHFSAFWLMLCCDFWLYFSAFNLFINWILTNELKRFSGRILWKRQSKENSRMMGRERGAGELLYAVCVHSTESEIVEASLLCSAPCGN